MTEKEEREIRELTEIAKYLADEDPISLLISKQGMELLKARCDLDKYDGMKTAG